MGPVESDTGNCFDPNNGQLQGRRGPREGWMLPINQTLLVTEAGPTQVLAVQITGNLIGWKAFGLTCLPLAWTPRFFVIAASCLADHQNESRLGQWIEDAFRNQQLAFDRSVVVRSSGTAETMRQRGRLHSKTCKPADILSTIRDLVARSAEHSEGDLHWIIQEAVPVICKGHLSNERHVAREQRDWVAEIEHSSNQGNVTFRIAVRSWRDGPPPTRYDLRCSSQTELTLCLKRVALWASQFSSRTHFEWVWDGKAISIVQSDKEEGPAGTNPRDLFPVDIPQIEVAALRLFRSASDQDYQTYRKLGNARLYAQLGYSMPQFFVLDDSATIANLFKGIVGPELDHDLTELTKRALVIRTDGKDIPDPEYEMLPRTEDIRSSHTAKQWLTGDFTNTIRESSLAEGSLCLIAHHFIPSVAAAWARAEPSGRMVRIESLWGLPEGLYWFAHDTFEIDTGRVEIEPDRTKATTRYRLRERLRFKGTFIAPDTTGKWIPHYPRAPYDWRRSISKRKWLFEIAHTTRLIAERIQHPVVVMWFVDNHSHATRHDVLPWFHHKSELKGPPNPAPRNKRPGATNFTITTKESWNELKRKIASGSRIERVIVKPSDPDLIRNRLFTEELAQLAVASGFVIVLSGGILSHAYYVLQRAGARLECVDLFGADEDVIEFNKLVRDRIPELIRQGGEGVATVSLRGEALITALRRKLVEEAYEALDASSGSDLVGELADVLEVIRGLRGHLHLSAADLKRERIDKRRKRGGFSRGLMLKETVTQHSLQTVPEAELLPGLGASDNEHAQETITEVADLPKAEFYRRPDLRQVDQTTIEKLLTFETSLPELPRLQAITQTFTFPLPIEERTEREFIITLDLERDRSALRGVIRIRPGGNRAAVAAVDDAQLRLDF